MIAIGIAAVVGVIIATLAIYLPGLRALRGEVTLGREALPTTGRPWWLRVRIDLVLLLAAAVVSAIFVVSGGFKPNPKAHDQSIARSFYVLLAPWCLWLGGTLLAARGFLALCARMASKVGPVDFRRHLVGKTLLRSISRRPRTVAAGIVALSLTVAFGVSLAIFVATFRSEQRADARFIVGSDVRVTPSLGQALPADIATLLGVPGVHAISPVAQDPAVVLGTDTVLFAAVDPQTFERVAPLNDGFFTDTTAHAAMTALARDPHAVLMDKETALSFNVRKGDTVKAQIPSPSLGQPILVTFHVAGTLIQLPGFPLGLDMVGNLSAYQQETGTISPSYFLLSTDGSSATSARVAHALTANLSTVVPARIETTARTSNKDQTSLAGLSLTGLGSFEGLYTLLIASLTTVILVAALLLQRGTERATMRALGLGRRRLQAVILGEAVVVIVTSIVVGALLGAPMAYMFVQILRRIFIVSTHPTRRPVLPSAPARRTPARDRDPLRDHHRRGHPSFAPPRTPPRRMNRRGPSGTRGNQDHVGGEAEEESEQDSPGGQFLEPELAADSEELDDDVENRSGGESEERDEQPLVDPGLPDDGAHERGAAADQAHEPEERPARSFAFGRHRCDDPESLGGVVQAEADDEQQREADLAGRGRLPDGEPFREVVEADAECDEQRETLRFAESGDRTRVEPQARRRRGAGSLGARCRAVAQPPVVVHEGDQSDGHADCQQRAIADEAPPRPAVVRGAGE